MLNVDQLLNALSSLYREGVLTEGNKIDSHTFICATEKLGERTVYHQFPYENIPEDLKKSFRNKQRGDVVGSLKIMAVFDVWA